jgi:hypothetical protein
MGEKSESRKSRDSLSSSFDEEKMQDSRNAKYPNHKKDI